MQKWVASSIFTIEVRQVKDKSEMEKNKNISAAEWILSLLIISI